MKKQFPLHEFKLTGDFRDMLAWGQKHFPPTEKNLFETISDAIQNKLTEILLDCEQLRHVELLAARLSGTEFTIQSFELERKAKLAAVSTPVVVLEAKPVEKQRSLF